MELATISNWCLVCLERRCMMHFHYLSYDGLTVSGKRFRRVRDVDMKNDYAFVDFSDPRDADDARYSLNGRQFDGSRLIVEFAKGAPRGPGGSREYVGRGVPPPPGSGRCFNCGLDGHWARDCKAGDWKNKCYRCGERGHIERNCHNSPKKLSRGRSNSRSPVRSRSPRRGRGRSRSFSRSRSYSRSRSPVKREKKGSKIPSSSRSPEPRNDSPPSKAMKRSPTPERDGSEYSESPRAKSPSPARSEMDSPAASPSETANGHGTIVSSSPREDISPVDDGDDNDNDNPGSPRGSESP